MTAYLTFTHSVSRPLIATLHLPGVCQPGRLITNLSGGVHEGYESSAGEEIMCSVEEYGDWHEPHTGLVTDDLLQRALNGSRHDGWLGLIRAVSSERLFHFTSLRGTTIKRYHRGSSASLSAQGEAERGWGNKPPSQITLMLEIHVWQLPDKTLSQPMRDRTGQTTHTHCLSNTFAQITANRYSSVGHIAALEIYFFIGKVVSHFYQAKWSGYDITHKKCDTKSHRFLLWCSQWHS